MEPLVVGWLSLVLMIILLFLGMPIAFVMLLISFLGYVVIAGFGPAISMVAMIAYVSLVKYQLTVVPLFIIMGHFAHFAGFANDLFKVTQKWLGHYRGGILHATVAGAAVLELLLALE